ncbi:MAG: 1-acyl-sn-glycerol-3-phosphate acyltransferase, partial [Candidatus Nanopelagicales bacterium]
SRYEGMASDRFVLRSITDEIMYELMVLSGQEYVDMYATKAKTELAAAQAAKADVPQQVSHLDEPVAAVIERDSAA